MKYKPRWKVKSYAKTTKGMSAKDLQQWYGISKSTAYRWLAKGEAERRNNETNNNH